MVFQAAPSFPAILKSKPLAKPTGGKATSNYEKKTSSMWITLIFEQEKQIPKAFLILAISFRLPARDKMILVTPQSFRTNLPSEESLHGIK